MRTKKEFYRVTNSNKSIRIPKYVIDFHAAFFMQKNSIHEFSDSLKLSKLRAKQLLEYHLNLTSVSNLSDSVSTFLLRECLTDE